MKRDWIQQSNTEGPQKKKKLKRDAVQINHHIYLKFLDMICYATNYYQVNKISINSNF